MIYKTDCYWYSEWQDMGATVQQCGKRSMGTCPCDECTMYISKDFVRKLVDDFQRGQAK